MMEGIKNTSVKTRYQYQLVVNVSVIGNFPLLVAISF